MNFYWTSAANRLAFRCCVAVGPVRPNLSPLKPVLEKSGVKLLKVSRKKEPPPVVILN